MNEEDYYNAVKEAAITLSKFKDDFLLEKLSAKKGEIVTKTDLKNYSFECPCCKKRKPATEAIILLKDLNIEQKPKKETMFFEVKQGMALICDDCQIRYFATEEQKLERKDST